MKKKIILALIILIFLGSISVIYLNSVFLPTKIKSLIINSLQEATQKKVSLDSLRFSIFKGLVLTNLKVYDETKTIVSFKEGSCAFLIPPIFKKRIIIPVLKLKSPEVFLERRKDNTFNLTEFFAKKIEGKQKSKFSIFVYKVRVTGGRINFQDDTLSPPFNKSIDNLDMSLSLSLSASAKFSLKAEIPTHPIMHINAKGQFIIPESRLTAKVSLHDLQPQEFLAYYQNLGFNINQGLTDALLDLKLENNILYVGITTQNKNLFVSKDKISAKFNSDIKAALQYGLKDKMLKFSAEATLLDSEVSGLEFVDEVSAINGKLTFNNSGISSDKLTADIWGVPVLVKINLTDFNNPLLDINVSSMLDLNLLQQILQDKLKLAFPGQIKGAGNLSLDIQAKIPSTGTLAAGGYLDLSDALIKLEKISSPFEGIKGRLEFSQNQLRWSNFNFKYLDIPYTTSGVLTNFQAPGVQLELSSPGISLQSNFAINNKLLKLSRLTGKYLNSEFSLTGDIDAGNLPDLETDIGGELIINLEDIKKPLQRFKKQLEQIKPHGIMKAQFNLNGNLNNIRACTVGAELSGNSISAYGLKAEEVLVNYNQAGGLIDLPLIHLSLYDGSVEAAAKMNLNSDNLPYWVNASIQGVKIEKLKQDTEAKDKDITGTIQGEVKINGFSGDLSKLNGAGKVFITEGKLWQLNLFKGLGSLLFDKDFASIIFNEGSCAFSIRDKYIFSDNLIMKSNIADLEGSVKISFDSSVYASLNVKVLDEMVPLKGTFKDITTAIVGQAGRFGVIKVSGTLKEPKYKFQTAVVDIIKGLKDVILGQ